MLESDEYIEPRFCYIQKRLLKLRQYLTTLIKGLRHHASLNVKHIPAYPGSKILHPAIDIDICHQPNKRQAFASTSINPGCSHHTCSQIKHCAPNWRFRPCVARGRQLS